MKNLLDSGGGGEKKQYEMFLFHMIPNLIKLKIWYLIWYRRKQKTDPIMAAALGLVKQRIDEVETKINDWESKMYYYYEYARQLGHNYENF